MTVRRRRAAVAATLAAVLVVPAAACGGSDEAEAPTAPAATADERAVCRSLQSVVDGAAAGDPAALGEFRRLETEVRGSANEVFRQQGAALFDTLNAPVEEAPSLTPEQSGAVGDQALGTAQPALGALIDECNRLGLPIENLPTGP